MAVADLLLAKNNHKLVYVWLPVKGSRNGGQYCRSKDQPCHCLPKQMSLPTVTLQEPSSQTVMTSKNAAFYNSVSRKNWVGIAQWVHRPTEKPCAVLTQVEFPSFQCRLCSHPTAPLFVIACFNIICAHQKSQTVATVRLLAWTHEHAACTARKGWRCSCGCCCLTQVRRAKFPRSELTKYKNKSWESRISEGSHI